MAIDETNYWTRMADARTSRRRLLRGAALGGAGLAAAALVGCGGEDEEAPAPAATVTGGGAAGGTATATATAAAKDEIKRGGTYRRHLTAAQTDVPDPHTSLAQAWSTWTYIGEALVQWSNDASEILPVLMESWEYSGDGLELVLNVRQGVKWHNKPPVNGRAFDAEDVVYNLKRIADMLKLPADEGKVFHRKSGLVGMTDAVAVDDHTVKVSFEFPSSPFVPALTNGRNSMVPREFPEQVAFEFGTIIGTGAWVMETFQDEQTAVLPANPEYWRKGQPYMDRVEWLWLPDAVSAQAAFAQGQVEFIDAASPTVRANIEKLAKDAVLVSWPFNSWNHFRFNTTRDPFGDPRVRLALHLVYDRKRLEDSQLGEGFWQSSGPSPSGFVDALQPDELAKMPGFRDEKDEDIAEAKRLMDAAGYPTGGVRFTMMPGTGGSYQEAAIRVFDMWQAVWPDMDVTMDLPADNAAFGKRQGQGDFDSIAYTFFAEGDIALDAHAQMHTKGGRNYGKFSDPKADELIDKALRQINAEERRETLLELQHYIIEEQMPAIPRNIAYAAAYIQPWVRGFEPTGPSGGSTGFDFGREAYKIWLDK